MLKQFQIKRITKFCLFVFPVMEDTVFLPILDSHSFSHSFGFPLEPSPVLHLSTSMQCPAVLDSSQTLISVCFWDPDCSVYLRHLLRRERPERHISFSSTSSCHPYCVLLAVLPACLLLNPAFLKVYSISLSQ